MISDVISEEKEKAFLFCNEAIVRGALESDVKVVAFYPGSPVSEILDTFYHLHKPVQIKRFTDVAIRMEIVTPDDIFLCLRCR